MKRIFVDTNAWVAINFKNDQAHQRAVETHQMLLKDGFSYVTTNFVLDETYTLLSIRAGRKASIQFGERIRKSNLIEIIYLSKEIEEESWRFFKKYNDHKLSYTDCTSFAVMNELRIKKGEGVYKGQNYTPATSPFAG